MRGFTVVLRVMYTTTTDSELVSRFLGGDQDAFKDIYDRYEPKIRNYLRSRVWDTDALEDVLQLTFIKCAESLRTLSDPEVLKSWLHQIAMNTAKDWAKSQCGTKKGQTRLATDVFRDRAGFDSRDGHQQNEGLDTYAVVSEDHGSSDDREYIRWLVLHLPRKYRRVAQLYWFEDKTLKEVADIEGITPHNVQTRSDYARKRLRQHVSGGRPLNLESVDLGLEGIETFRLQDLLVDADREVFAKMIDGVFNDNTEKVIEGLLETLNQLTSS